MPEDTLIAENIYTRLVIGAERFLTLRLPTNHGELDLYPPIFHVDHDFVSPSELIAVGDSTVVWGHVRERVATFGFGETAPHLYLDVAVRSVYDSPVYRFCYRLRSDKTAELTKPEGEEALTYFSADFGNLSEYDVAAKEMRFAEFNSLFHSFMLTETPLAPRDFAAGRSVVGPFLVFSADRDDCAGLVAYEHGSQSNDPFLTYDLHESGGRAKLRAVKGNYWRGQAITPESLVGS